MQAPSLALALEGHAETPSLALEGVHNGFIVFHPTAVGGQTSSTHVLQYTSGIDLEYEVCSMATETLTMTFGSDLRCVMAFAASVRASKSCWNFGVPE